MTSLENPVEAIDERSAYQRRELHSDPNVGGTRFGSLLEAIDNKISKSNFQDVT